MKNKLDLNLSLLSKHSTAFFLQSVFEKVAFKTKETDPLRQLIHDEFVYISQDFDSTHIQESWSWRNTHIARGLSILLIDEKGEMRRGVLFKAIQLLQEKIYSLGPGRHHDASRQQHLLNTLSLFYEKEKYIQALKRICRPFNHPGIERLIRATLFIPKKTPLTDAHARCAALSALLTSLRQNVGSCFATAPAILIQQDQPLNFLSDISQIFGTGRLTRIFEGVEYTVPLSLSWGVGDLFKPILLNILGKNPLKLLAFSPGLQAAFESIGLIDKKMNREQKHKICHELLKSAKFNLSERESFSSINADQLIKAVLLHTYSIKEQDVFDFQERSIQGPLAELIMQKPFAKEGKSVSCSRYLQAYDAAKDAFKALTDNALLKAWEFSLASLSESQADFAKWHLFISLGVESSEADGIGQCLYTLIQEKIIKINAEIEEFQSKYEHLFAQAKYLEGRLANPTNEREIGWVQAEYQIRRHEINRALSERDAIYEKGRRLQELYPILINFYSKKIRDYFQEVYDAEMHDISNNPYDDSPAGFRLLYKHGRSNAALWTVINSGAEYIQHLTSFFISTEVELNQLPHFKGLEKEVGEFVTAVIMTIKRPEFLESSFFRLAQAYNETVIDHPLENLDKVKRKPWAYVSGGTMATLTSCYWGNAQKPQEAKRWVESENELLAFLIDTLKECPLSVQQKYQTNPSLSMLAFSPTHAFLCKPGWKLFQKAWESDVYTYTWMRDYWVAGQTKFLDSLLLDNRMIEVIVHHLLFFIPVGYRPIVKNSLRSFSHAMTPPEFREQALKILSYEKWLHGGRKLDLITEELDSILYRFIPLFPEHALKEKLEILFDSIEEIESSQKKDILHLCEEAAENIGKYKILTAEDLKNIAKSLLILTQNETRSAIFYHQKITEAMQKQGLCYPQPLLFADTNWVNNYFGFIVNPGNRQLEFWRFDACGGEGRPISIWKRYLNGVNKQEWGLYTLPHQYGQL